MKIKLLEVSLDPQQLQLGTCEVCFSVEFAQFPTFKFEIDESATEYVEMYAYHAPYSYDKINVQLGFEYNWQEKQFNYEILAWNPDATAFGLGHGLELFINSDATEPYKVAYYGMDVDADILQPELTQALDKIVGLLK